MNKEAKIFIAGHKGLVGSAILQRLKELKFSRLLTRTHAELDLTDQKQTERFFADEQPDYVFLAAAKVGGIVANSSFPGEFIFKNLQIQNNVIESSRLHNVRRLLFLGSSCIYPRDCAQPMKEEYLLTGPLESTNRPYAIAKIAGIEMCWAYNRQFKTQYLAAMPTNLYGYNDNFDLNTSHVIPALIRKFHEAKMEKESTVEVWGSGAPRREFLNSADMADACVFLMSLSDSNFSELAHPSRCPLINVGIGEDLTILELAQTIKEVVGFNGEIVFDKTKPDGTFQKLMDIRKLTDLGWSAKIDLRAGLESVYKKHFLDSKENQ